MKPGLVPGLVFAPPTWQLVGTCQAITERPLPSEYQSAFLGSVSKTGLLQVLTTCPVLKCPAPVSSGGTIRGTRDRCVHVAHMQSFRDLWEAML